MDAVITPTIPFAQFVDGHGRVFRLATQRPGGRVWVGFHNAPPVEMTDDGFLEWCSWIRLAGRN